MIEDRNVNLHYEIMLNAIIQKCSEKNIPVYSAEIPGLENYQWQVDGCMCNPDEYDRKNKGPHNSREGHWPVCMHSHIAKKIIRNYKIKRTAKYIPLKYDYNKLTIVLK